MYLNSTRKAGSILSAFKCTTELEIGKEKRPRVKKEKIFKARGVMGEGWWWSLSWKVGTSAYYLVPPPTTTNQCRAQHELESFTMNW